MAPVIWGLDLAEMKWGKFKSSHMWNNVYHLRRTKFIVYQCALIFLVFSESLGTAVLSDYVDQQRFVARQNSNAYEYNNDYIGVASYNIFAGIFTAFIFGGAFFFDLFWPERKEIRGVRSAWKICGVLSIVFTFASALALTIITARRSAYITGVSASEAARLVASFPHKVNQNTDPLVYRHNPRAIAAVVFVWPGFLSTVASCIILFMSIKHDDQHGPFSSHVRTERDIKDDSNQEQSFGTGREAMGNQDNLDPEAGTLNIGRNTEKSTQSPIDVAPHTLASVHRGTPA